jgi:hypothetical protein
VTACLLDVFGIVVGNLLFTSLIRCCVRRKGAYLV